MLRPQQVSALVQTLAQIHYLRRGRVVGKHPSRNGTVFTVVGSGVRQQIFLLLGSTTSHEDLALDRELVFFIITLREFGLLVGRADSKRVQLRFFGQEVRVRWDQFCAGEPMLQTWDS